MFSFVRFLWPVICAPVVLNSPVAVRYETSLPTTPVPSLYKRYNGVVPDPVPSTCTIKDFIFGHWHPSDHEDTVYLNFHTGTGCLLPVNEESDDVKKYGAAVKWYTEVYMDWQLQKMLSHPVPLNKIRGNGGGMHYVKPLTSALIEGNCLHHHIRVHFDVKDKQIVRHPDFGFYYKAQTVTFLRADVFHDDTGAFERECTLWHLNQTERDDGCTHCGWLQDPIRT